MIIIYSASCIVYTFTITTVSHADCWTIFFFLTDRTSRQRNKGAFKVLFTDIELFLQFEESKDPVGLLGEHKGLPG